MARRYYIAHLPISHINGKLAPAAVKCSNQADTDTNGISFLYGYRRRRDGRSRYAYRSKCRNLAVKPYTAAEIASRNSFTNAIAVAKNNRHKWSNAAQEFEKSKYKVLYNFIIAAILNNNGIFPSRWE